MMMWMMNTNQSFQQAPFFIVLSKHHVRYRLFSFFTLSFSGNFLSLVSKYVNPTHISKSKSILLHETFARYPKARWSLSSLDSCSGHCLGLTLGPWSYSILIVNTLVLEYLPLQLDYGLWRWKLLLCYHCITILSSTMLNK